MIWRKQALCADILLESGNPHLFLKKQIAYDEVVIITPASIRFAHLSLKGDLSCKMHFWMSFIHKYVSPVFQGTHKVSENTTLSLFLRAQFSKNGGTTDPDLLPIWRNIGNVGWLYTDCPIRNVAINCYHNYFQSTRLYDHYRYKKIRE